MARQEVGKVQEMLTMSSQEQQEADGESENSENKGLSAINRLWWVGINYHGNLLFMSEVHDL